MNIKKYKIVTIISLISFVFNISIVQASTTKNSLNHSVTAKAVESRKKSEIGIIGRDPELNAYGFSIINEKLEKSKEFLNTLNYFASYVPFLSNAMNLYSGDAIKLKVVKQTNLIERHLLQARLVSEEKFQKVVDENPSITDGEKAGILMELLEESDSFLQEYHDKATTVEQKNAVVKYHAAITSKTLSNGLEILKKVAGYDIPKVKEQLSIHNIKFEGIEANIESMLENMAQQDKSIESIENKFSEFKSEYNTFAANTTQAISNNANAIKQTNNRITELGKVVVQQGQILTEFGEVINDQGEVLGQHGYRLDELEGVLVDLDKEMNLIADDVSFNQSLIFGMLPTKEKLRALKNPRFLEKAFKDKPEEREKLKSKLKLKELQEDIASEIKTYTGYLKGAAIIAGNLGIGSEEDQKKINQAVEYATIADNVASNLASGNYLGIAVTISGLFSKKNNNSPEQQRYEAIMGMLRQVDAKLDVIDQKVDHIIELQMNTLEAIANLEKVMNNQFQSIKEELTFIAWEQQAIKELVIGTSPIKNYLLNCEMFLATRDVDESTVPDFINFPVGNFSTWEDLEAHFNNNNNSYDTCQEALTPLFPYQLSSINPLLLMQSYSTDNGKEGMIKNFIDPVYNPIKEIFINNYGEDTNTFYCLCNPSFNYDDLTNKVYVDSYFMDDTKNQMGIISSLIHPQQLLYYGYMLLELLVYEDIVNKSNSSLKSLDEIIFEENYNPSYVLILIDSALRLNNLAIAQQTLLNGDAAIPLIHKKLFSKRISIEMRNNAIKALGNNPYLAHNYLVYRFNKEMPYAGRISGDYESYQNRFEKNLDIYRAVLDGSEPCDSLDKIFTTNWNYDSDYIKTSIKCDGNEIFIILENQLEGEDHLASILSLPNPESVENKTYRYRNELDQLTDLRNKLMSYAFGNYESVTLSDLYHLFYEADEDQNIAPIPLMGDSYLVETGKQIDIPAKYYDVEDDEVQVEIGTNPNNGSASIEDGVLTYTADNDSEEKDVITLRFNDGKGVTEKTFTFFKLAKINPIDDGGDGSTDNCPNDPDKTEPGECGCGVAEGTCSGGIPPAGDVSSDDENGGSGGCFINSLN